MFYIRSPSSFYGYPVQDTTPSPSSYEEQYYREVAAEHRRRADAALALAQQEHARTVLRQRQAQAQAQAARLRAERERQHELYLARARAEQQHHFGGRPTSFHHPGFSSFQPEEPRTVGPRRVLHSQQPHGPTDGPFIDFLSEILNAFQPEEPCASNPQEPKKEVRINDAKGKGKAREEDLAPQAQPTRKEEQQPEEEEDFISNLLHALRSGESDDLLRQMGILSPSSSGAGPSSSTAAPRQTPKKAAAAPVSVPVRGPSTSPSSTPSSPHAQSFTSIDGIQHRFDALKASFQFPTTLDFESSTSTSAKLPYNQTNAPVHTYESELIKLLTKLDAVDSDGAESVRGARRALVLAVERELDAIDAGKERVWKAQQLEKQKEEVDIAADPVEQPTIGPIIVEDSAVIAEEGAPTAAEEPVTGYFVGPTPTQDTTSYTAGPVAENVVAAAATSNLPTAATTTGEEVSVIADAALSAVSLGADNAAEEVVTTASPDHIDSVLTDTESELGDEEPATIPGVAGREEFDAVSDTSLDEMVEVRDSDSEQTVTALASSLKAKVAEDSDDFEML